jgi:hypothetical protein
MMAQTDNIDVLRYEYEIAKLRGLVRRAQRLLAATPPLQPAQANEVWEASVARWMADEGGSREENS